MPSIGSVSHGQTYMYGGFGVWPISADLTEEMLNKALDGRGVKRVDTLEDLNKDAKLIVIPGGSIGMMFQCIGLKADKIQQFVNSGGKLLGICAGAILATKTFISKPQDTESSDKNIRSLHRQGQLSDGEYLWKDQIGDDAWSLYPGRCVAPHIVKNPNIATHPENLCAVDVFSEYEGVVKTFKACHYSGPAFLETPPGAKVLLRYQDPIHLQRVECGYDHAKKVSAYRLTGERIDYDKPVAALSYPYGEGKMVLTGIHPEIDCATFSKSAAKHKFPQKFPAELQASELARQAFVDTIFSELS